MSRGEWGGVADCATALVSLDCHAPIIALVNGTLIHFRVETAKRTRSRMSGVIGLPERIQENTGMTDERLTAMVMEIHRDPLRRGGK